MIVETAGGMIPFICHVFFNFVWWFFWPKFCF